MLNIAIISDIHGNLPALNAVLADISQRGADQIYCLGDLTDAAPWHNEVISLIRRRHIPVIMGNHDERIAFDLPIVPLSKHGPEETAARITAINYTKATITPDNSRFLANLPAFIQLHFGRYKLMLAHGSLRSNDEYLYQQHDEDDLFQMMQQQQADALVVGHTHISYIRHLYNGEKLLVNAGSVGRTKEQDGMATYVLLQIDQHHTGAPAAFFNPVIRKVAYPLEETLEGIRSSPIPDFYAGLLAVRI
ncbi:MAG TPA: metallophosphoesterase family protein [Chitinophaga sp.]|uniref:metallophosphoesterase family protein n=1 Tax=Chitinophaga sp. TaxID=1869181 RepID=UPI002BF7F99C|nr:metallophosphoesterase family protein [Chitinophaga sp.]HVI46397.1 metallophosphoesterase family protein [Chitinophaga sp.]